MLLAKLLTRLADLGRLVELDGDIDVPYRAQVLFQGRPDCSEIDNSDGFADTRNSRSRPYNCKWFTSVRPNESRVGFLGDFIEATQTIWRWWYDRSITISSNLLLWHDLQPLQVHVALCSLKNDIS